MDDPPPSQLLPGHWVLCFRGESGLAATAKTLLGAWGGASRSHDRSAKERVAALVREATLGGLGKAAAAAGAGAAPAALAAGVWAAGPEWHALGAGAAAAAHRAWPAAGGPLGGGRPQPDVFHDRARGLLCVFSGQLSNLGELAAAHDGPAGGGAEPWPSPTSVAEPHARAGPAEAVARAYAAAAARAGGGRGDAADAALVVLSELQGGYAFAIYDGERRAALAARGPSGGEPLFWAPPDDAGVCHVASAPLRAAGEAGAPAPEWAELPAGHLLSGRPPRAAQFALTAAQLDERRAGYEDDGGDGGGASPSAADTASPAHRSLVDALDALGLGLGAE